MIDATNISIYIEMIPDPRTCRLEHNFVDIVTIALLAKICGAEGWEDMEEFGLSRIDWLRSFLELPSGIPSPDSFRRVISHIEPIAFLEAFLEWIQAVKNVVPELINIDGKTLRPAFDNKTGIGEVVRGQKATGDQVLYQQPTAPGRNSCSHN
jgi:hypothetical protein